MNRTIQRPYARAAGATPLKEQIESLIRRLHQPAKPERRRHQRFAVPVLLELTPLDAEGQPLTELATTVVGKDISQRGLSFFHDQPLVYRRAIVSLDDPRLGRFAAEIDIRWCRFTRPGWYESGGRLLRAVAAQPARGAAGFAKPLNLAS